MTMHSFVRFTRAQIALAILVALTGANTLAAQNPTNPQFPRSNALGPRIAYTAKTSHADTLRGSFTTPGRNWWDVSFYDLHVASSPSDSSIRGYHSNTSRRTKP